MNDFEKNLKNLRPEVQVDRFKQTLRRDLLRRMHRQSPPGMRLALGLTGSAAAILGLLVISFVVAPELPARLHRAMGGDGTAQAPPGAAAAGMSSGETPLRELLERSDASIQRDRAFLEVLYQQGSEPVKVKEIQGERFLAIRQFELSNGEKVAVLTDLGAPSRPRQVQDVAKIARTF
jgi:hypothetical protein